MNSTKIIQWNLNGFYEKLDEVKLIIQKHQPDIICLQETNFKNNQTGLIKNYNCYHTNRINCLRASGGTAIYVKNNLPSTQLSINTHLENTSVKVHLYDSTINICNIYLPNQTPFIDSDLTNILNKLPSPSLILGDFNSHNYMWGSSKIDDRGKEVEKFIDSQNLVLLNNGEPTRISPNDGKLSSIDLAMANPALAQRLEWSTSNDIYTSDHLPIIIQYIPRQNNFHQLNATKWNLKSPKWDLFSSKLENKIKYTSNYENKNIEQLTEFLTEAILETANLTIGTNTIKNMKPRVPWWNNEIKEIIKIKKNIFNKYKKNKTLDNFIELKQARARAKFLIKSSKKKSWQEFTTTINHQTNSKIIWNKIRSLKGLNRDKTIELLNEENSSLITNPEEVVNNIAKYFHQNSSDINYSEEFKKYKQQAENNIIEPLGDPLAALQLQLNIPIGMDELNTTIKKCKTKSAGPDNIPYCFIHNFGPLTKACLLHLYNKIYEEGKFPINWKTGIIIPIHKPGKNKFKVEGYRPITLLNTMCKIFEKIINFRLNWYLENISFFIPQQSGFRKKRSTIDNLMFIKHEIENCFKSKGVLGLVSLDINKAYDTTWRYEILRQLSKVLSKGNMYNTITDFLSDRTFRVKNNNIISDIHELQNGVPQGSALSVTLFLIAINNIATNIKPPVKYTLFADDFNFMCCSTNQNTVQKFLQEATTNIQGWSTKTGFSFSPQKSNCILFTKRRKKTSLKIVLNNNELPELKSIKILGIEFDSKMTFGLHIKGIKSNIQSYLNILKIISHTTWGGQTTTLIQLFKSLILSKLNYGIIIYKNTNKSNLKIINTIYNSGIRMTLGAFRTSPAESMYNITNIPPLEIKTAELELVYAARIIRQRDNPASKVIEKLKRKAYEKHIPLDFIIKSEKSLQSPWSLNFNINTELTKFYKKDTMPSTYRSNMNAILEQYQDYTSIFTDASKLENGSGIAAMSEKSKIVLTNQTKSSIFTLEAIAISTAIDMTLEQPSKKYIIFSDSLSVIESIKNKFSDEELTQSIHNKLISASNLGKEIIIMWVPGHCGIKGNEEADRAAKSAITNTSATTIKKLTVKDIIRLIKENTTKEWQLRWQNGYSKLHEIKKSIKPWPKSVSLKRNEEVKINRLRIGHTLMTHKHILEKNEEPICEVCNTAKTVKHVITECIKFEELRAENSIDHSLAVSLGPDEKEQRKTLKFLYDSNLYIDI